MKKKVLLIGCSIFAVLLVGGVGAVIALKSYAREVRTKQVLTSLALGIYDYHLKTGQCPTRIEDLDKSSIATDFPAHLADAKKGNYVIVWPAELEGGPDTHGHLVLAYEKDAPTKGGWVCTGDMKLTRMTPDQLQTALQAKGK